MTARERRIVRMAELAAMNPPDAEKLLSKVVGALGGMARAGRLQDVDHLLAAMRPSTARLITLMALSGQKITLSPDLLARREDAYEGALQHERAGETDALAHAREIREEVERHAGERDNARSNRQRDRDFLARLRERRSKPTDGGDPRCR